MTTMSNQVAVTELPQCDFCAGEAEYDAKTTLGPWANMCEGDFQTYGVGQLGTGFGQKLVVLTY